MADGNQTVTRQFIAYQDEAHGLGRKAADEIRDQTIRARAKKGEIDTPPNISPRRTARQTLSTLIGKQASKAVVPLQNDLGGYDKRTLEALLDFVGWRITGAHELDDNYVLAVPTCQVLELGEANFPSAFKGRPHAVGNLPNGREARAMLFNRVGRIHATADAKDRCAAALDGYEAQGITISQLADTENAYRKVLEIANEGLDPDRQITTHYNDLTNTVERASRSSGKSYTKSLDAVLLPGNTVSLQSDNLSEHYDYIIVDEHQGGNLPIRTRFLELDRIEKVIDYSKAPTKRVKVQVKAFENWAKSVNSAFNNQALAIAGEDKSAKFVRVLMKIDSRGKNVKDVGLFTKKLTDRKLPYTMTVLNDRPETLPVIFEIEVANSEEARKQIRSFFRDIQFETEAWGVKFLGNYATNTGFPEGARHVVSGDSFNEKLLKVAVPILATAVVLLGAALFFFLRDGDKSAALPSTTLPMSKPAVIDLAEAPQEPKPTSQAAPIIEQAESPISAPVPAPAAPIATAEAAPIPVSFAAVRSIPETWWICGNKDLVTSSLNSAQCSGDTAPATYATQARDAFSTQNLADSIIQNASVRAQLCSAHTLVVTGSASSSPFENNASLPSDRATLWATSLKQALASKCSNAPAVLPLSLGVASTHNDLASDRQLLILTAKADRSETLSGPAIEGQLAEWLSTANLPEDKTPLFKRMSDKNVFRSENLVWVNSQKVAHLHSSSN